MTNKNKLLIILTIIFILILAISIIPPNFNKKILETYTLNEQGLLKNNEIILDEKFDKNKNLTYYKYKSTNNDILEFNYNYEYDNQNRIVKISLNNNDYALIEYTEDNKISKIDENVSNFLPNTKINLQFIFNYPSDSEMIVYKNITNSEDTQENSTQNYILNYKNITYNNKNCIQLTESYGKTIINEIVYEKSTKKPDYSNFNDIINIVPLGYLSENNTFRSTSTNNNSLLMLYPVYYNGNIIYSKNYIQNSYADYDCATENIYYDKSNRPLKAENKGYETEQTINYMYKSINSNEYNEYRLIKITNNSSTIYKYVQNKIYLNVNNDICKKEVLKSDEINEKEYNSKIKKFEKYFETENK